MPAFKSGKLYQLIHSDGNFTTSIGELCAFLVKKITEKHIIDLEQHDDTNPKVGKYLFIPKYSIIMCCTRPTAIYSGPKASRLPSYRLQAFLWNEKLVAFRTDSGALDLFECCSS